MAEVLLLEEREILAEEFVENPSFGAYVAYLTPTPFLVELGKSYKVVWDGTEYYCDAQDAGTIIEGALFIGNAEPFGLYGNGEPFIIGGQPTSPTNVMCLTDEEATTHRVAVYQIVEVPGADIKIKGYSGAEFEYQNVPKVWLAAPESTVDNPVLVPYTYGEAVDGVEIVPDFSSGDHEMKMPAGEMARSAVVKNPDSLIPGNIKAGETVAGITGEYEGEVPETEEVTIPADFSAGDMVVEPSEGKYLAKTTVQKPETLIPENIAEGVNIAGIIGSFAGGSNIKFATGTFTGNANEPVQVKHGLGDVPDIIILNSGMSPSNTSFTKYIELCATGMSSALKSASGTTYLMAQLGMIQKGSEKYRSFNEKGIDTTSSMPMHCLINRADAEQFYVGNDSVGTYTGDTYNWTAISGIT